MIKRFIHALVRQERVLFVLSQPSEDINQLTQCINAMARITPHIRYAFDVQYWNSIRDLLDRVNSDVLSAIVCFDSQSQDESSAKDLRDAITQSQLVICCDLMLGVTPSGYSVVSNALVGVFSHYCCVLLHSVSSTKRYLEEQSAASAISDHVLCLVKGVYCHAVGDTIEVLSAVSYYHNRATQLDITTCCGHEHCERNKKDNGKRALRKDKRYVTPPPPPFPTSSAIAPISVSAICFASMPIEEESHDSYDSETSTVLDEEEEHAVNTELGPAYSMDYDMPYVSAPSITATYSLSRNNSLWRGLSTSSKFSDFDFGALPPMSQFSTLSTVEDNINRSHSLRSVESNTGNLFGVFSQFSQEEEGPQDGATT